MKITHFGANSKVDYLGSNYTKRSDVISCQSAFLIFYYILIWPTAILPGVVRPAFISQEISKGLQRLRSGCLLCLDNYTCFTGNFAQTSRAFCDTRRKSKMKRHPVCYIAPGITKEYKVLCILLCVGCRYDYTDSLIICLHNL